MLIIMSLDAIREQIFGDPDAADIVFTSGADILGVGINVTHQVVLTGTILGNFYSTLLLTFDEKHTYLSKKCLLIIHILHICDLKVVSYKFIVESLTLRVF